MIAEHDEIVRAYTEALAAYLGAGGEAALSRAYEIGRRAALLGIGVVEMAMIHDDAVRAVATNGPPSAASQFLIESLSPFEMTHRGFREANQRLEEANQRLEAVNRELEAFSYSVSHDLRAPLRAIASFADALAEDAGPSLEPASAKHLDRVIANAARMGELIDALLELSRISVGRVERRPVDITQLATAIIAELRARDPARDVDVDIAGGLQARGDARLLKIALENLIGNAWKFTAKLKQAAIGVAAIERGLVVRDNGAGFDAANAVHLFTPFRRFHGSGEFPGTGIGLATVRRIVERHGGRIWAESVPGAGAAFFITLS
jgi:signal transduction histidine kinase